MADTERADAPPHDPEHTQEHDPIFDIEPPLMQAYYALRLITLMDPDDLSSGDYEGAMFMLGMTSLENLIQAQKHFEAAIAYRRGNSGGAS